MAKRNDIPKEAWIKIDPASLSGKAKETWLAYEGTSKAAGEARRAFEAAMLATYKVPAGKTVKIGTLYGLAVAIVDTDTLTARKGAVSAKEAFGG